MSTFVFPYYNNRMTQLPTFRPYESGDAKILDDYAEETVFLVGDGDLTPDSQHCFYLLELEGELIGYCEAECTLTRHLNKDDPSFFLTKLALRRKFQSDEYVSLMLLELMHAARELGVCYLYMLNEPLPCEKNFHVYEAATMGIYMGENSVDYLKSLRVIPLAARLILNPGFLVRK